MNIIPHTYIMPEGTAIDFDMINPLVSQARVNVVAIVLDYWDCGVSSPFAPDAKKDFLSCFDQHDGCVFYEHLLSIKYVLSIPTLSYSPIYELLVGSRKMYLSKRYIDVYNEQVVELLKCP